MRTTPGLASINPTQRFKIDRICVIVFGFDEHYLRNPATFTTPSHTYQKEKSIMGRRDADHKLTPKFRPGKLAADLHRKTWSDKDKADDKKDESKDDKKGK